MEGSLDAESFEQFCCIVFSGIAASIGEFLLQLSHAYAVFVGEVLLAVEGFALFCDVPEYGVPHEHGVEDGVLVVFEVVLR